MSNYVNNLNELINTKNEFKEIIIESGQTPGEVFSYYPNMIRNAIAGGGGSLVDYPTYTYVATYYPDFTYLFSYVGDAISDVPAPDLSSYVTHTELDSSAYITAAYLVANKYLHNDAQGRLVGDLAVNVLKAQSVGINYNLDINCNAYTYNIIPQENNTYTLGDSSYLYTATYSSNIYLSEKNGWENVSTWQTRFKLDGNTKYYLTSNRFYPGTNESASLGLSNQRFLDTYTANIYTENVSYTSGKSKILMNDRNVDIYANSKKMINLSDYNGLVPIQTNVNLGGSSNKWSTTYTANIYADNAYISNYNNFIWTGTSAQYASLDNYTSYQIYLIKEA